VRTNAEGRGPQAKRPVYILSFEPSDCVLAALSNLLKAFPITRDGRPDPNLGHQK
jgi:hypothetical protein